METKTATNKKTEKNPRHISTECICQVIIFIHDIYYLLTCFLHISFYQNIIHVIVDGLLIINIQSLWFLCIHDSGAHNDIALVCTSVCTTLYKTDRKSFHPVVSNSFSLKCVSSAFYKWCAVMVVEKKKKKKSNLWSLVWIVSLISPWP